MKTHKFSELEAKMSPERRARIDEAVQKTLAEMAVQEQRGVRSLADETNDGGACFPAGELGVRVWF